MPETLLDKANDLQKELTKNLADKALTLDEMREYKARYKEIAAIGRATWANYKEIERVQRKAWIARIMDEALKEEAEGKTHAAKRAKAAVSATETELENIKNGNLVERFLDKEAMFRDWDRRFGKMGDAVKEQLYDFSREAFVQKQNNIDLRMREIMPDIYNGKIEKDISVKNIKLDGVGKDGRAHEVSKADLMTLYIGLENEHFKAAQLYGKMMSAAQRSQMRAEFTKLTSDQYINRAMKDRDISKTAAGKLMRGEAMDMIYEAYGKPREEALREAIKKHLTDKDKALAEAGRDNFEAHYDELKEISYFLTNKDIGSEDNYLPMLRISDGTKTLSDEEQARQILKVNGANITTAKADNGMTIERQDILPWHQSDIETDFFKLIPKGIEREEHFKAYGALIRDFNEIFRGKSNESKELQEKIKIMHGNAAMEAIGTWINHQATPTSKSVGRGDKMLDSMLGKFALAKIGYNHVSWIKQYPQTISPFAAYTSIGSIVNFNS